jgi:hypothetical protein
LTCGPVVGSAASSSPECLRSPTPLGVFCSGGASRSGLPGSLLPRGERFLPTHGSCSRLGYPLVGPTDNTSFTLGGGSPKGGSWDPQQVIEHLRSDGRVRVLSWFNLLSDFSEING